MSKQNFKKDSMRISKLIIQKEKFNFSFSELIEKELPDIQNTSIYVNEIVLILSEMGYEIISFDPLEIEKK